MDKRIIEETPSTEVLNDDWLIKDSPTGGTSKILGSKLKEIISGDVEDSIDKILDSIAPEWSSTSTYGFDAYVIHEGELWRCFKDTGSTRGEFKTSEWIKGVTSGYITHVIDKIADRFVASNPPFMTYRYSVGDMVFYAEPYHDEQLYVCNTDLPQGESTFNPEHWDVVYTVAGLSKYLMDKIAEAGQIDDVKVDGVSVVDENKVAQITTPDADAISYDNTTSGLEADDVQDALDEVVTDIESVETALETKADVDGFYDELYAGNLLSDNTETDNAPYLYRQSPSGKSCVDLSVVGGTVAWNQLVPNGNFASTSGWNGTLTAINGGKCTFTKRNPNGDQFLYRDYTVVLGHKYLLMCEAKMTDNASANYAYIQFGTKIDITSTSIEEYGLIIEMTNSPNKRLLLQNGYDSGMETYYVMLINLTQAFGSTIADYVYSLEQATAGSGIAWLKSYGFLTKDYYAYDSGSLQSVNVASRKVVGKNLVESTLANTTINTNGEINVSGGSSTFDMHIAKIIKGETYTIQSDESQNVNQKFVGGFFYEMPQLGSISYNNARLANTPATFTAPIDGYVAFRTSHNYAFAQIELGSTATDYEPYTSTTYPFDSDLTLRGIPKLDSNNKLYYDGDIYKSDGSVTRKYGVVDLGSLEWTYHSASGNYGDYFDTYITDIKKGDSAIISNIICPIYQAITSQVIATSGYDNKVMAVANNNTRFIVCNQSYTDATTFTTAMNGVYLVYELDTPTTESAQPFTNPQLVGSTEEFIDASTSASTPTRDVDIPVGQDSKYHTDLKAKLEELAKIPDVPSSNGTYTLKATRSASGVTYSWVSG